jgi:hypothetical protein
MTESESMNLRICQYHGGSIARFRLLTPLDMRRINSKAMTVDYLGGRCG